MPVWGAGGPWGGGNTGGPMSMTAGMSAKAEGLIADEDGEHEGHHGEGPNMFQKAGLQIASSIQVTGFTRDRWGGALSGHVHTATAFRYFPTV